MNDRELLIRDKYNGDTSVDLTADEARLAAGEPLAYIIGWVPFLGLTIRLDSHPLIPRPETEWWTEKLIAHVREKFGDREFTLLDLCAGSGAIGIAVLHAFPNARVCFGELIPEHVTQIEENIRVNDLREALDSERAIVYESNLFDSFAKEQYDVIATNPPYVPEAQELSPEVTNFEPAEALYSGSDGLDLIRRIATEAKQHLLPGGELWMECDISNIEATAELVRAAGAHATIHDDLYGRPRTIVGHFE